MTYNWQLKNWPNFTFDLKPSTEDHLFNFAERIGRVSGLMDGFDSSTQLSTVIEIMVSEAVKTSEIEGEYVSRQDVRSSIRNNLGLSVPKETVKDQKAEGAAALMILGRDYYADPLSEAMIFEWHRALVFSDWRIQKGAWRTHEEPMQIVSGPLGKEKIHYEAPPSKNVPDEMRSFIQWFNDTAPGGPFEISRSVIRSALVHVYFETIHPFEDGNGRIGRALSEKALSQGIGRPVLLSLSASIETNRNEYYDQLNAAQRTLNVTDWIDYFVHMCLDAQIKAEEKIQLTLHKAKLFDRFEHQMNERQLKVIRRLLDGEADDMDQKISAKKYIKLTKASPATATRDLQDLVHLGVLQQEGAGRSVRYVIKL